MVSSRKPDSDVIAIWRWMELKRHRVRVATSKFPVRQHVRISKEKMTFAKAAERNFSTELFRIVKVIHRRPRVFYKLEDLNCKQIDVQFYQEELPPVRINSRTTYMIYKILDNSIREVLVRWQGYGREFDPWIPAASVNNI